MNKNQLLTRVACGLGYLAFAGFSAYFTASSLSLNLLQGTNLWIVFILVLVVSIIAGVCLDGFIKELKKRNKFDVKKAKFVFCFIGFIVFWGFSFTTNVHYFFVQKHGLTILEKELTGCKDYIAKETQDNVRKIDEQKEADKAYINAKIYTLLVSFNNELNSTLPNNEGFGEFCVDKLRQMETEFKWNSGKYNDQNEYVMFENNDRGDLGKKGKKNLDPLYKKYLFRADQHMETKFKVIDNFYDRKKEINEDLNGLALVVDTLEKQHLPAVLKDGSIKAFYKYSNQQNSKLVNKMPEAYAKQCIVKEKNTDKVKEYKVYPSSRMFDTMAVWGDILKGLLKGMAMIQWILISLIFDVIAFILFYFK